MFTFPQIVIGEETIGGFYRAARRRPRRPARRAARGVSPTSRLSAVRAARPPGGRAAAAGSARTRRSPGRRRRSCAPAGHTAGTARLRAGGPGTGPGTSRARRRRGGSRRSRRPSPRFPAASASSIASRSRAHWAAGQPAGGAQRMDPGAEQRLVGVDVADPGDPPLVEHERLDRRLAAARDPRAGARR